jgi:murein L,D-transpeptidase YafK
VELWASDGGAPAFVRSYPILDASGHSGPKLKEWDMQVPEGIYRIVLLNPASAYHLSMKVDYPNAYDRRRAREDGRGDLGGDIYIHGGDQSIGCLAVGDRAIEDLFVLVARAGVDHVEVIIAPSDLRRRAPPKPADSPPWVRELYGRIAASLKPFQLR